MGFVDDNEHLIGFVRIFTDFVYRAVIFDVIIKQTHRNQGLGKLLLDSVINHPQLQSVEYLGLFCLPEMVPFYQRWGFTTGIAGLQLMLRPHYNVQPFNYD
ncbi:MAG: GNAT family N-acetyltransferase [Potamolinea sp.]